MTIECNMFWTEIRIILQKNPSVVPQNVNNTHHEEYDELKNNLPQMSDKNGFLGGL